MSERERSVTVRLPAARSLIGLLAAAVLIAGSVVAGVRTHHLADQKARLEHGLSPLALSALTTARSYAIQFATYSYDNLDAAFAATEAHSVDPFLSQYRSETAQLTSSLTAAKASSSAEIVSAGLVSLSPQSATVDLFLNQTIRNSSGSHLDAQRVEMSMVRKADHWFISKVVLP